MRQRFQKRDKITTVAHKLHFSHLFTRHLLLQMHKCLNFLKLLQHKGLWCLFLLISKAFAHFKDKNSCSKSHLTSKINLPDLSWFTSAASSLSIRHTAASTYSRMKADHKFSHTNIPLRNEISTLKGKHNYTVLQYVNRSILLQKTNKQKKS